MYVSDGVDQGVEPQDDAGALGPLCAHQAVLAQQDFADVFGARHPNDRFPEKVGLEHVAMTLSAWDVEVGALECEDEFCQVPVCHILVTTQQQALKVQV